MRSVHHKIEYANEEEVQSLVMIQIKESLWNYLRAEIYWKVEFSIYVNIGGLLVEVLDIR